MAAQQRHLLLQVRPVSAWQLAAGEQDFLGSNLTLDVLLVEDESATAGNPPPATGSDAPPTYGQAAGRWLLLSIDGLVEAPLSSHSRVMFNSPAGYIVPLVPSPSQDAAAGPEKRPPTRGGFLKFELAANVDADDREDLESILSSWTAFGGQYGGGPNPAEATSSPARHGRLALVDDSGAVVGELEDNVQLSEDPSLAAPTSAVHPGQDEPFTSDEPVVITLPSSQDGQMIASVSPLSHIREGYGQSDSKIVSGAEWISRGLLVGSERLSAKMSSSARNYTTSRPATETPLVFTDKAKRRADRVQGVARSAVMLSGRGAAAVGRVASRVGQSIGKKTAPSNPSPPGEDKPPSKFKAAFGAGIAAIDTVATALEQSGKHLILSASDSANTVVTHKYGHDAGHMSRAFTNTAQGVGLVYIDVRGVAHRALLKQAGKAAIKGRMADGREVILAPEDEMKKVEKDLEAMEAEEGGRASGKPSPVPSPRRSPMPGSSPSLAPDFDAAKAQWQAEGTTVGGAEYGSSDAASTPSRSRLGPEAQRTPSRGWDPKTGSGLGAAYRGRYD